MDQREGTPARAGPTMSSRSPRPSGERAGERRVIRPVILVGGGAVLVLVAAFALRGAGSERLPPELLGHWTTTSDRYEGRAFSLGESRLAIYTSPADSTVHPIRRVTKDDGEGLLVYTIEYEDGAIAPELALAYGPPGARGAPEWIHFPHQPEIEWRKARSN